MSLVNTRILEVEVYVGRGLVLAAEGLGGRVGRRREPCLHSGDKGTSLALISSAYPMPSEIQCTYQNIKSTWWRYVICTGFCYYSWLTATM